jgi:glycosyltransferase involved in cell wall biosynthesis
MRLAWFSPLAPARTGIAGYSADVLPLLDAAGLQIDRFDEPRAHDFVWRHRRDPYDLVVYQLGNSPWHDYIWGYLFRYPGLVVLHDARLHHARAAQLLRDRRVDDYRREFAYDHPDTSPAAAEFAAQGLLGPAFYFWPMTRAVVESARLVAVHNEFVAADLRTRHPAARVERIRLGTPDRTPAPDARERIRRAHGIPADAVVFVAFGLVTPEKRIEPVLRALGGLGSRAHLLIVGANGFPGLGELIAEGRVEDRVHITGYVADDRIADYLAAGDVSLSLRWPTAEETSAAWIESLAASRPTVVSSLPHTAHVPTLDARTWRATRPSKTPVAVSVDLLEEDDALRAAMSRLADDGELRAALGAAGHAYWKAEHHVSLTAGDYRRVIAEAAALPAPDTAGLPAHLTSDYSALATSIAGEIGLDLASLL